jgi:hypothetical protein
MMGSEAMTAAAQTCTECVTTPDIIVEDLKVSLDSSLFSSLLPFTPFPFTRVADKPDIHGNMRDHR